MNNKIFFLLSILSAFALESCQDYFYGYPYEDYYLTPENFELSSNIDNSMLNDNELIFEWDGWYNNNYSISDYQDVELVVKIYPSSSSDTKLFTAKLKEGYLTIPVKAFFLNDSDYSREYHYSCELRDVVDSYPLPDHEGWLRISPDVDLDYSSDRETLMEIYRTAGGENWYYSDNWGSDLPLEYWYGVGTDGRGHVTELYLSRNNLNGSISDANLPYLQDLDLSNNNLNLIQIKAPRLRWWSFYYAFDTENGATLDIYSPDIDLYISECPGLRVIKGTYYRLLVQSLNIGDITKDQPNGIEIDVEANEVNLYDIKGLTRVNCNGGCYLQNCKIGNDNNGLSVTADSYITMHYTNDYQQIFANTKSLSVYDCNIGTLFPENVDYAYLEFSNIDVIHHQGFNHNSHIEMQNLNLGNIQEGENNPVYINYCEFNYSAENWINNLMPYVTNQ